VELPLSLAERIPHISMNAADPVIVVPTVFPCSVLADFVFFFGDPNRETLLAQHDLTTNIENITRFIQLMSVCEWACMGEEMKELGGAAVCMMTDAMARKEVHATIPLPTLEELTDCCKHYEAVIGPVDNVPDLLDRMKY
jgi:hypothetical protein